MKNFSIEQHKPIREVISLLESNATRMAVVVDSANKVVGTVTDGDIRRYFLSQGVLDGSVKSAMNSSPITFFEHQSTHELRQLLEIHAIEAAPMIARDGTLIDICTRS